jgi:RNA polymerase sigma factor (sigma-70 family)
VGPARALQVWRTPSVEPIEMGTVARLRRRWHAPHEPVPPEREPLPFDSFFEDEQLRLLRILSVITGSRGEAEDLAQEAFTRLFERWEAVAVMDDPAGYLHRTAMNLFRNQARRARVALQRAVGFAPEQDVFKHVEDRDLAAQALASLTPRQRAALVLTEALGYSGEETGRLLGIKASTVWALTHQARATLSKSVEATDG